ncbi:hypothetical protein F4225_05495 [Candidatus Poribacteria bacterium]|nr:hypothetical protein [Candidatus Poribacteria bacterium]
MKHFFTLTLIGIIALCNFGCSSDEEPSDVDSPTMPSMENPLDGTPEVTAMSDVVPLPDDVILESMDETEAEKLEDKTPVQIVTVLEGTQRVTIAARFRGVRYLGFGFPLYECELMSDDVEKMGGIAAGMSGSPVGPPGKVMGALAYGDYFSASPTRFWVTSIEAMESARDHLTFGDELEELLNAAPSARINAAYAPVKTPLKITGIKPNRLQHIESYLKGSHFDYIELFADVGSAPITLSTDRDLMAGDMIGVAISTGDVVNAIGFGTVTQVYDDNTFVAFGHPFSAYGDGKTALPVYRATVNGLVPNLQNTYKSVSAYGDPIGTVTKDLIPGIVGELGEAPNTIPFSIKYQRGNDVIEKEHQVAYGYERYIPIIAAVTQDAIRLETSPTTIEVTIKLSFKESQKDYTETFLSAAEDTYIETLFTTQRIISTFTDKFTNITEKATLTSVELTMTEKPQIMTVVIQEIIAPDQIVQGTTETFTVVLLPHWTAVQDGERKIEKQITLSIPSDYSRGDAWISVFSKDPDDLFFGFDFDFDFDSDSEDESLPENLDELIDKLQDEQNEDPGLITIVLSDEIVLPDELLLDEPKNEITLEGFIVTGAESESVEIE